MSLILGTDATPARIAPDDLMVRRDIEIEAATKKLIARQCKGKALKAMRLSPLLAKRRLEHVIPDGAFRDAPMFDWVHVYQIGAEDTVTATQTFEKGGRIVMPETTKQWASDVSPRGVLLSAGPLAMDHLRTNGAAVGHIVRFVRLAPYRIIVDTIDGRDISVLVMRSGSIESSQDLEDAKRRGETKLVWDPKADGGRGQHVYVDTKTKQAWVPRETWVPADYG